MPSKETNLPQIVFLARDGATLSDLQACAGKLWRGEDAAKADSDGAVKNAITAHWKTLPGSDPYWDFLSTRGACSRCGEANKYEKLSICPNCFSTFCCREPRACDCGHAALGLKRVSIILKRQSQGSFLSSPVYGGGVILAKAGMTEGGSLIKLFVAAVN